MNGPNPAAVRPDTAAPPVPFVGRRAQLAVIEAAIVELGNGRATDGHVVAGPVGSGRSAFLGAAVHLAARLGWIVVEASVRPGSGGPAASGRGAAGGDRGAPGFGGDGAGRGAGTDGEADGEVDPEGHVLGTVVREAVRAAGAQLADRRPGATAVRELARLCDEPVSASAAGARRLALALGAAADESRCGVVLVIDDVDLAAGAQLVAESLASASRRALPCFVLVSAGCGFDPEGELVHVDLGPFDAGDLAALLSAHGRSGPNANGLVEHLADCSDGWPGLAVRMAAVAPEHWPQVLEDVVGSRLRGLVPAERRYLETVAQLGAEGVSVVSVARALGDSTRFSPESSTLQGTREALTRAGLLCSPRADRVSLALAGTAAWLRAR